MQVFICYSRADKEFAAQLVQDLSDYVLTVWMDVRSIPHGANWDMEVQKGLDSSDDMLVLLSPTSVLSQNVADEWSYFIEKNKPIVPLMLQPCDVPFRLMRRQRVDFSADYQAGFVQLLQALGNPPLVDPDSTQKLHIPKAKPAVSAAPTATMKAPPQQAPQQSVQGIPQTGSLAPVKTAAPAENDNAISSTALRTLPVVWAKSYHWFYGMNEGTNEGELMVNHKEIVLVPRSAPVIAIPLKNLISVKMQHSVDQYLKIAYYNTYGAPQALVLMGATRRQRRTVNHQVLTALKEQTGRPLD